MVDKSTEKVSNREILGLLLRYIRPYKKYLIISLSLVIIIISINVSIPYIFKYIIDSVIIKTGYLLDFNNFKSFKFSGKKEKEIILKRGRLINSNYLFLPKSSMRFISSRLYRRLIEDRVFSSDKIYIMVSKPQLNNEIRLKLNSLIKNKSCLNFGSLYLIEVKSLRYFTLHEISLLRQWDIKILLLYIMVLLSLFGILFFSTYYQIINLMRLAQFTMRDLRRDLFTHIINLKVSFFDKTPVGRLVSKVSNDIDTLGEFFSSVMVTLFQDILIMLSIATVMFLIDFKLSLIVMSVSPLVIIFLAFFRIRARRIYGLIRTKISNLNSFINETVSGIKIVKVFAGEEQIYNKFLVNNRALYKAQMKQLFVLAIFRPLISFVRWLAIALLIYYGAIGIIRQNVSYGMIIMFITYIEKFYSPIREISEKFDIMQSAAAAVEKILSIFKEKDIEIFTSVKNGGDVKFRGEIEFKNVYFSYRKGEEVLNGLNLKIKPEEKVAIVGATGAGKTTVINLLQRFYLPDSGLITVDGLDISRIPVNVVRKNIVSVMQEPFLFSRTIKENIISGNSYNDERFWKTLDILNITDFILSLPERENTLLLERGANLSTGERQLISFARALYTDPDVLILDEATSSIDSHTEIMIQQAIENLIKNRTSIVIAHRLSTIKNVDRIVVLDSGRIIEEGTHDELIKIKGNYYKLYLLQFNSK